MAGYASYADFNNQRPISARYDSHRQSLQDSLNETVEKPFLAPDWNKGEGTYEAGESGRRRSALVVTKKKEWASALKRGNKGQRIVFGVFAFCAALGLTLYFVIPRVPAIYFDTTIDALTSTDQAPTVSSSPATFSFYTNLSLTVDSRSNYIRTHLSNFNLIVLDTATLAQVGTGSLSSISLPGQSLSTIIVPLHFSGTFHNSTTQAYSDIRSACQTAYPTTPRSLLSLSLQMTYNVAGTVGGSSSSSALSEIACPVIFSPSSG